MLIALCLALAGCGRDPGVSEAGEERASGDSVATAEGLLDWIARHPSNAGLVVLPDDGPPAVSLRADRRSPLASTRKVLVVGALIASDVDLDERVARRAVERFYVPGTDGGAHEAARLDDERPTLRQLMAATIEVSDNASADALLARVGADPVDAWARRRGMQRQDPILPVFGELAAWTRDAGWTRRSPARRARRARRARSLAEDVAPREVGLPAVARQRELAAASVAGTPAEWAQLMRRIAREGDRALVAALDWPRRQSTQTARAFDRYLTKGGKPARDRHRGLLRAAPRRPWRRRSAVPA
jgi:beta-lactamase class A